MSEKRFEALSYVVNDDSAKSRKSARWPMFKAMALAVGLSVAGCQENPKNTLKTEKGADIHNHSFTQKELLERFGSLWRGVRIVDYDNAFIYFQTSPMRFVKVRNSQTNMVYFNRIFSNWRHKLNECKTKEEKNRINAFYEHKITQEITKIGMWVE